MTWGDKVRYQGKVYIVTSLPDDNQFGQLLLMPEEGNGGQVVAYPEEIEECPVEIADKSVAAEIAELEGMLEEAKAVTRGRKREHNGKTGHCERKP